MIVRKRVPSRLLLALFSCAASSCARDTERVHENGVHLRYVPGCAPARVERVVVEALGDFALGTRSVGALSFTRAGTAEALADLPEDAALYRLSVEQAEFRGYALVPALAEGVQSDALLLPLATTCEVEALASFYAPGAAVARAGTYLVLAGVADADGASRTILRAAVAEQEVTRVPAGLFVPRVLTTALSVGEEAWFVGGAAEDTLGTRALDTFERYGGSAVSGLGRLASPRVSPLLALLSDGSVLVAGGSERVGGALSATFERIAAPNGDAVVLASRLPFTPDALSLVARDDGLVTLLAQAGEGVRVFELDPAADALIERNVPAVAPLSALSVPSACALPGGRVAALEVREGVATGRVWLALPGGDDALLGDFLPSFGGLLPRVSHALGDGRVLLVGTRDELAELRLIDPGRRSVTSHTVPFAVDLLVAAADGSVVGLGPLGSWVLREDTLTRYDNPGGTLLADDVSALALDADGRFERAGLSLRALVDGARFDLATLAFADMQVTVRASAGSELLLLRSDGKARSVAVGGARVGPAFCEIDHVDGEAVELVRRGPRVEVRAGASTRTCNLDGLTGPLRVAMRFTRASQVDELRVARE